VYFTKVMGPLATLLKRNIGDTYLDLVVAMGAHTPQDTGDAVTAAAPEVLAGHGSPDTAAQMHSAAHLETKDTMARSLADADARRSEQLSSLAAARAVVAAEAE
jgi:hypothetical protein